MTFSKNKYKCYKETETTRIVCVTTQKAAEGSFLWEPVFIAFEGLPLSQPLGRSL